ncbi:MAG: 1,4-alpha-glucan branching protein GlgB [Nitrospinota bacterium]
MSDYDFHLFNEGNHFRLYNFLGAHPALEDNVSGVRFSVWAPNAEKVSVIGDFNGWNADSHSMSPQNESGIWSLFIPQLKEGEIYKYHIRSRYQGYEIEKADPFSYFNEVPPKSGSIVQPLDYSWNDEDWMKERKKFNDIKTQPVSIYELHLGSWKKHDAVRSYSYRELAQPLSDYVKKMGFTHVEIMPVMEHPFFGSWGYQTTGYFSPTSRYGTPQDLMFLIDTLHQNEIGVILDWVPSHFAVDGHGLSFFDGTHLYEHKDLKKGWHPDWGSYIFNYGRNEVLSFLISNALFWLDRYHVDGLRVDAVASMLYLDYSRKDNEWIPNKHGGNENLEAIDFIKKLNEEIYKEYPDVQTIAEESTAWPGVSRPTYLGGLGFGLKWDMGWMHDVLSYMGKIPVLRKYHHDQLTFRSLYAFSENFVLSLSHDEMVHGKGSLINKMSGDTWQKFANLRLLFGYMFAQSGKKLIFMGGEFGQWEEWDHDSSLNWELLKKPEHSGLQKWVQDLNRIYRDYPSLHSKDLDEQGFEWIDCGNVEESILILLRKGDEKSEPMVVVLNFTPAPRFKYRIGVPREGLWKEVLNSDAHDYHGSGVGNLGGVESDSVPFHGQPYSLEITLPPLSAVFLSRS